METQRAHDQHRKNDQENAIIKEMLPYFLYALIPLAITITIALVFAPKMTLP
jgi:hypothetical protein